MSVWGYVLLFFNLLAAGGLGYLSTQDWVKRQEVTAVALKYHLVVKGLPTETPKFEVDTDENPMVPLRVETTGGVVTDNVRTSFVKAYFQGADGGPLLGTTGGKPVLSQMDEVERVKLKLKDILSGAGDDGKKLALLCGAYAEDPMAVRAKFTPGWLVALARSFEEREIVEKLARSTEKATAVEAAEKILFGYFETAIAKADPKRAEAQAATIKAASEKYRASPDDKAAQKELLEALAGKPAAESAGEIVPPRDESDRRRLVAHLLMFLDPTPEWQKRVVLVVGLRAYSVALSEQTARLTDFIRDLQRIIEADNVAFSAEYVLLRQLAFDRAAMLDVLSQTKVNLESLKANADEAQKQRARQLADREAILAALKADVAKKLTEQADIEGKLFDVQKLVGETLRKNFELEDQLDAAETKKLGR